jgi:HK97 family phage major capsid protein
MLEDSAINLDAYLAEEFARRFARHEGTAFVSGNSTLSPEGILTNANITSSNGGDANNITADGILDLIYALPSEYRRNGTFLMNRNSTLECRKLKNNQNDYLWQPSYAAGQPPTLCGFPVLEAPDFPDPANASCPICFGDFRRGYLIVDRIGLDIQRLVERYIEFGTIGFLARKRVGGQVVDDAAIKKMVIAA